jgi:hypothetical protein
MLIRHLQELVADGIVERDDINTSTSSIALFVSRDSSDASSARGSTRNTMEK